MVKKKITVPSPNGFVKITDEMTAVKKFVQHLDDPMNDTLAFYISESDVPTAIAGELPVLERYFILKVNKELRNMTVGKDEFSQFKEVAKSQIKQTLADVKLLMPELMDKISQGISEEFDFDFAIDVSEVIPLEPHYEVENAWASSMYYNYGTTVGSQKEHHIVAGTSTFLNTSGIILFLHGYAPKDELEWTKKASINWS
jgi:hypothetical protein